MKSLVIYFSHTGENWTSSGIGNIYKGNTEIVAETIKNLIATDIFKVEEVNPYPYNYRECCEVAKKELNNNERPLIKEELNNIVEYDTIIIGSPIWYGHLPMPLFTQLEKLDFTNKNIKFFVTHEGSGLGDIPTDIEKLCSKGNLSEGLAIRGSRANECTEQLKTWLLKEG